MRIHLRVLGVLPCTLTHFPFICGYSHNIKNHILYLHLLNFYLKYLWKIIMNAQLQFGLSNFFSKIGSMTCKVSMFKIWCKYMMFQVSFHMIKKFIIVICIYRCIFLLIFFSSIKCASIIPKIWWVFWC